MSDNEIKCPKCGERIPITEVLKHRLNEQVNSEVAKRLELETTKIQNELQEKFAAEESKELKIYKEKLKFEEEKRAEAQQRELDFIRKQNELSDKLKNQELVIARKIQEERKIIEEKVRGEEQEKQDFVVMELRKQLDDTKKSLSEAQRKAAQGSMQTQGEVIELTLEDNLKKRFLHDIIEPVGKGILGADIVQKVVTQSGEVAGIIAWESKQTKAWTEDWVQKLKDDGHRVKANLLVLVSNILPKDVDRFGPYKGIWVTDYVSMIGLAGALRNNLLAIYSVALANEGSQDKAMILYKHLTSQTFANRVKTLADTFGAMKQGIDKERRAYESLWSAREMQIERLSSNSSQMFGEIQGIVGGQFSGVEILEDLATKELTALKKTSKKTDEKNQANLF